MLASIKKELNVPVVSDIHSIEQIEPAAEVLDILTNSSFLMPSNRPCLRCS